MVTLPKLLIEPLVHAALLEDLGPAGDLTTDTIVSADAQTTCVLSARQPGVICGLDFSGLAFQLLDPRIKLNIYCPDGSYVNPGDKLATVTGPARGILSGERVALNFLSHLSGVATATRQIVSVIAGTKTQVCCTRKTIPGLRAAQKYAVRVGGGSNHRFGLGDAVLIKDNHVALAGSIKAALSRARAGIGHLVKIELEVDTLDQLQEAMEIGVDAVLLDNMGPDVLRKAVALVDGRAITEASGGITPKTALQIAQSGVDLMSMGWLTNNTCALDIGLDYQD